MNLPSLPRALPRRLDYPALLGLSLLIASPLAAQSSAAANEDPVVLSPFTVNADNSDRYRSADAVSAVRIRAPLIDTASSISVITRDMMDDLAPTRVFDVTRYVSGVQEGRGIQFQDRMIIRGFETQNGARTVDNFLQSADADNVEESVIERIEVSKGPNAILSPAGAPGGSLNIITKSPSFRQRRSLSVQLGLFDSQKATLDMTGPIGDSKSLAYRLVGSYQDSARYWDSSAKIKNKAVAPMITWRVSDQTQVTAKLIAAEHWIFREPALIVDPNMAPGTEDPKLAPGFSYNGLNGTQPWSHVGTSSVDLFTTLTTALNENMSFRIAVNGRHYYSDSDQEFVQGLPGLGNRYNPYTGDFTLNTVWALQNSSLAHNATSNPYVGTPTAFFNPGAIGRRGQIQWTRANTANFQADELLKYQFGPVDSQTVVGFAYSRQRGHSRSKDPGTMPNLDLSNLAISAYPVYPANLTAHNGNSYTNGQAFISQRFGFFDNRFFLSGGYLRYATLTQTWSWNVTTGVENARNVLDDAKNMWSLSGLWKVRDNVSIYASRSTNASPVIANQLPLWRSGVQNEFGAKAEFFDRKLSVTVAHFEIAQTNVTVPNPARQNDPTQPEQLISDLSNKGYEFEVMGRVTDQLSIIATYSKLKMRDALGRMVRGVADNNAAALVSYRFSDSQVKGLTMNAGISYSGRRAGDAPINYTPLNVVARTGFYLKPQYVDTFGATYRVNDSYSFRLNIDNVFDRKNYLTVAGGVFWGTGLTTATGRNIRFTTTFNW